MTDETASPTAPPGGAYAWYALGVLIVAYTFSYLDRQALALMVDPIRQSLDISDTQLSLLHGFAFALFYTVLGLPLGRLVDQYRRTAIIATGVAMWSVMTASCGLAKNFTHMFLARAGVGVGEASLSPGAYSLIGDYFPAKKRPLALSLYLSAIYVGSGIAMIVGGTIIAWMPPMNLPLVGVLAPWQGVFIAMGLPGLLVALWVLTLREPRRTDTKVGAKPAFGATFRYLAEHKALYTTLILGYSFFSLMWLGTLAWFPTYFIRIHEWTTGEVGTRFGLVVMTSGALGVVLGGLCAGRLRTRGYLDGNVLVGLFATLIAMPSGIMAALAGDAWIALGALFVFQFACAMPFGAAAAALQEVTPNQMRGQVSAIYQFAGNMFGYGLGPTVIAVLTDHFFNDDMAVGRSIMIATVFSAPIAFLLLWLARGHYRRTLANLDFNRPDPQPEQAARFQGAGTVSPA